MTGLVILSVIVLIYLLGHSNGRERSKDEIRDLFNDPRKRRK